MKKIKIYYRYFDSAVNIRATSGWEKINSNVYNHIQRNNKYPNLYLITIVDVHLSMLVPAYTTSNVYYLSFGEYLNTKGQLEVTMIIYWYN